MAAITLAQAKSQLRVDHDDEDAHITELVDEAQARVETILGYGLDTLDDIPKDIISAIKVLVSHNYEYREPGADKAPQFASGLSNIEGYLHNQLFNHRKLVKDDA